MTEPLYTRCPGCDTIFRASAEQVALREGQVRCGQCRAVFDANNHRLALDPPRDIHNADGESDVDTEPDKPTPDAESEAEGEPDTRAPEAESEGEGAPDTRAPGVQSDGEVEADAHEPDVESEVEATHDNAEPEVAVAKEEAPLPLRDATLRGERFEWRPRKSLRERPKTLYGALIALLVAGVAIQALFEYRDALAAHVPFTRSLLEAACAAAGCSVGPLHDAGALSIDASDLQADPAHRGLLELTATIRNRAAYPVAWPHLELTLTDASDNIVARRALAPAQYAGAGADPAHGIPGNGEDLVTLFIDASQTSQAGYRLYLFYP